MDMRHSTADIVPCGDMLMMICPCAGRAIPISRSAPRSFSLSSLVSVVFMASLSCRFRNGAERRAKRPGDLRDAWNGESLPQRFFQHPTQQWTVGASPGKNDLLLGGKALHHPGD